MNPTLDPIFQRRSIRAYEDKAIPEETIRDLLEAAMAAPSAVAKDPWHFIIVREQAVREKITEALPNGQMLKQAPLGIVVCGDQDKAHGGELSYLLQDCSAAIENLLLAASMLKLGAVWLGVHPREERIVHVRELFGLPDNIIPVGAIAVGWPAQEPVARTRYEEAVVHWERW